MAKRDFQFTREARLWTVTVPARTIGRHVIEERVYERIGAIDRADAIMQAVRWSAAEQGVGPWKPSLREMCVGVTVEAHVEDVRIG